MDQDSHTHRKLPITDTDFELSADCLRLKVKAEKNRKMGQKTRKHILCIGGYNAEHADHL